VQGEPQEKKNQTRSFYYPSPVFDVKKTSCTSYCPPPKNYAQPIGEGKKTRAQKIAQPQLKNGRLKEKQRSYS